MCTNDSYTNHMPPDDNLLTLLRNVYRLSARHYREELGHLHLTARQAALLLAIEEHPGHGVRFAATQIGADLATCSALVARLEDGGLVERRAHPEDRRRTMLNVTPSARPLVEAVLEARAAADARIVAAAGNDLPRLRTLLARLADRLRAGEDELMKPALDGGRTRP